MPTSAPPFPPLARRVSLADSIEVTIEVTTTSTYTSPTPTELRPPYPPPPPCSPPPTPSSAPPIYAFPPLSTPLSFFPFPTSSLEPPPGYRSVPCTLAERYFLWGVLCPFLWILGARKLWSPEPIVGAGKHATFVGGFDFTDREVDEESVVRGLGGPNEWTSGNPEESRKLWREVSRAVVLSEWVGADAVSRKRSFGRRGVCGARRDSWWSLG